MDGAVRINTHYATRSTHDGHWVDADLAYALVDIGRPISLGQLELFALAIATGLGHSIHATQFMIVAESFLADIRRSGPLSNEHRHALILILGGMLRTMFSSAPPLGLAALLYGQVRQFQDVITTEFRLKPPMLGSFEDFENSFTYRIGIDHESLFKFEFRGAIVERAATIEVMLAKQFCGEVCDEYTAITQGSDITAIEWAFQRNELAIEQFAAARRQSHLKAVTRYRSLFQILSCDNGPWSTLELVPKRHYKLQNVIFKRFVRLRMKPNLEFKDHRGASLARDLGSFDNARSVYETELSKMKMQEFKGDFALLNLCDEDVKDQKTVSLTDVVLRCEAQLVTPPKVFNGTLYVTKTDVSFDSSEKVVRILLSWISKVYFRRYLLVDSGIEIFTTKRKAYFINFNKDDRQTFFAKLSQLKLTNLKFCQKTADDMKRLSLKAMAKWQQGQLSNFAYLMKLNNYSGRSYNDLSQYPVMPWILSDYSSSSIDLSSPMVYRDLTLPVGALSASRLEDMESRMSDAFDEDSRYLYGSLYSSAAVVIGYLIRMEPFTSLHITLQSNRFDQADRLFHSIPEAWDSVQHTPMDFRELIPEFFVLPDFLVNADRFDLGRLVSGSPVDDVTLPPWASSARHFIDVNRQALESKFVSSRLHFWIDLIFGPKSRAPLFEGAHNVFHPFFYETALTPAVLSDPRRCSVVREYSACFGAIPGRLFEESPASRTFYLHRFPSRPICRTILHLESQLLALTHDRGALIAIDSGLRFAVCANGDIVKGRLQLSRPSELTGVSPIVAASRRTAAACFPWSGTLVAFGLRSGACASTFLADDHTLSITAIAIRDGLVVSGGRDGVIRLMKQKESGSRTQRYVCLAKHEKQICHIKINNRLQEAVSVSRDGFLLTMSLINGRYLRGVKLPLGAPSDLTISENGIIGICYNGVDSHTIVVLDQNLVKVTKRVYDGRVLCWTTVIFNGCEWLVIGMKKGVSGVLAMLQLPEIDGVVRFVDIPIIPENIVCSCQDFICYFAGKDGVVSSFHFGM
jgi:hypothetical protein